MKNRPTLTDCVQRASSLNNDPVLTILLQLGFLSLVGTALRAVHDVRRIETLKTPRDSC